VWTTCRGQSCERAERVGGAAHVVGSRTQSHWNHPARGEPSLARWSTLPGDAAHRGCTDTTHHLRRVPSCGAWQSRCRREWPQARRQRILRRWRLCAEFTAYWMNYLTKKYGHYRIFRNKLYQLNCYELISDVKDSLLSPMLFVWICLFVLCFCWYTGNAILCIFNIFIGFCSANHTCVHVHLLVVAKDETNKRLEMLLVGYSESVDASIRNVFATAAMRFGHTFLPASISRADRQYRVINASHTPLSQVTNIQFTLPIPVDSCFKSQPTATAFCLLLHIATLFATDSFTCYCYTLRSLCVTFHCLFSYVYTYLFLNSHFLPLDHSFVTCLTLSDWLYGLRTLPDMLANCYILLYLSTSFETSQFNCIA